MEKYPFISRAYQGQTVTAADNQFPHYARSPYPSSGHGSLNINLKQCLNEVQAFGLETNWPDVIWCWLAVGNPAQMWGTLGCFICRNHYQSVDRWKHSHTWQRNVSVTGELKIWHWTINVNVCVRQSIRKRQGVIFLISNWHTLIHRIKTGVVSYNCLAKWIYVYLFSACKQWVSRIIVSR